MSDLSSLYDAHKDLPEEAQRKAGQAIAGNMGSTHDRFLTLITGLIESGAIDVTRPDTFFRLETYDALPELDRSAVDRATVNITDQLRRIYEFFRSKKTPDSSPHLQTMIEHLWQMKSRVEAKYGDVYKF